MLPEIKYFSIPIYISDDSSDDNTKNMIFELQKRYKFLFYSKNIMSLGHDKNIFSTLKLADTEYVWLLGDALALKMGAIKHLLKITNQFRPEIISVNAVDRNLNINSDFYEEKNKVLSEFGWHLTLTGATIYSRSAISTINRLDPGVHKNFPQVALIFNHLSISCSFYWMNERCVYSNGNKKSYWISDMFKVFIDDWSTVIRNLPECYSNTVKEKVIIEHSRRANIFGLRSLLKARSIDAYNIRVFREHAIELVEHSGRSKFILVVIALIPKATLKIFKFAKRKFKV